PSRRRHTRFSRDWSSDVCSSDLRRGLLLSVAAAAVTSAFPAAARNVESDVTARLRREGFRIVSRKRTLLGRVRVLAAKGKLQRRSEERRVGNESGGRWWETRRQH